MAKEKAKAKSPARAAKSSAPAKADKVREQSKEKSVAATARAPSASKSTNGKHESGYTFITNGFRSHPDPEDGVPIANLDKAKWNTQAELQKLWADRVGEIAEKDYVAGGGDPGIFSSRFTKQVKQIMPLDHVWCYSTGLGMVNLDATYPQYDLGEYDSSIKHALDTGQISEREWWKFVCGLSGNSITSVIKDSVAHGRRVLLALPPLQYTIFRDDLKAAVEAVGLDAMRGHLRVFGPELEGLMTPSLLPCLMPYDREALDRLVPGNRSHGIRRLVRLFVDVCPPTDGPTKPSGKNGDSDYEKLVEAFQDHDHEPIVYETGMADKVTKLKRLSDDDLRAEVRKYADVCGPISQRIMRMMRADGIGITTEAIDAVLTGGSGGGSAKRGRERERD